jgi:hypothetical protein
MKEVFLLFSSYMDDLDGLLSTKEVGEDWSLMSAMVPSQ